MAINPSRNFPWDNITDEKAWVRIKEKAFCFVGLKIVVVVVVLGIRDYKL